MEPRATREVWITRRSDGVTELTPRLCPLDVGERWVVIATVVICAAGFFTTGFMPAPVLGTILAACLAGEVVLGAKAVVLALVRPLAEVHDVSRSPRRR